MQSYHPPRSPAIFSITGIYTTLNLQRFMIFATYRRSILALLSTEGPSPRKVISKTMVVPLKEVLLLRLELYAA